MKISVDDQELYSLTEVQKQVICNDILKEDFDVDMKRRLKWVLNKKYEDCYKRLKEQWEPKLIESGLKSLPTDKDEFAKLVFCHPEYKCRSDREKLVSIS